MKLIFVVLAFFCSSAHAASSSSGIRIPVRMALQAGYQSSTNSWNENNEYLSMGSLAVGADFSVPIKAIKFALGLSGWIAFPSNSGDRTSSSMFLLGLYGRYLGNGYDFHLGPAAAVMGTKLTEADASPDKSIKYDSGTMACAMGGGRLFFGKDVSAGIGVSAFYCGTGSYKKTVENSSSASSQVEVSEKASSYGVMGFLFLEWNEERALL